LRDRCDPTLTLWLTGPDWIEVTVTAEVAPVSWQAAIGLDTRVIEKLQEFLHPLRGGLDEQGWDFGRKPHKSDLYALIEGIEGVSYVRSLTVTEDDQGKVIRPDRFLVFSGNHAITLIEPESKNN
jgi:hypothetical protein